MQMRKFVDEVKGPDIWIVQARWTVVMMDVIRIAEARLEGRVAGTAYIGGIRTCEIRVKLEIVGDALIHAKLESVVLPRASILHLDDRGEIRISGAGIP